MPKKEAPAAKKRLSGAEIHINDVLFPVSGVKKAGANIAPAQARHCRGNLILTCTTHAGGSPLSCFSASNVQARSKPPREACDSPENMASLIKDVGFIKSLTHTAGFVPLCPDILSVPALYTYAGKKQREFLSRQEQSTPRPRQREQRRTARKPPAARRGRRRSRGSPRRFPQ